MFTLIEFDPGKGKTRLFYAWDAISFTTMAAGPISIHFVCFETRRPAGNCFATSVLVGRDVTAAIVVNEMRETAVQKGVLLCPKASLRKWCIAVRFHVIMYQQWPITCKLIFTERE